MKLLANKIEVEPVRNPNEHTMTNNDPFYILIAEIFT